MVHSKKKQKDSPSEEQTESSPGRSAVGDGLNSAVWLVGLLICVFAFKSSVLDANNIPSASMIPTLKIGDYLFVNKMRYSFHIPFMGNELIAYDNPARGDIITFLPPSKNEKNYVKRVIGMPGDRFRLRVLSVCDLLGENSSRAPDGKPFTLPPRKERDFSCPGLNEEAGRFDAPQFAYYEYRQAGQGPWLNYGPRVMPDKLARAELSDSDSVDLVLHPDLIPAWMSTRAKLPVLFQETIDGEQHYFLESFDDHTIGTGQSYTNVMYSDIVPDCSRERMREEGCLIPERQYLVMGDNRDNSTDSRMIGLIDRERIRGKALVIYFSVNWYRETCGEIMSSIDAVPDGLGALGNTVRGLELPDFDTQDQASYCAMDDINPETGLVSRPLHFLSKMLIRKDVRWGRIGRLLK